jgi:hypothetical protein
MASLEGRCGSKPAWRRYFSFWLDGVERGWGIPVFLVGFVVVWTLTLVFAYWNAGLHPDVLETWSVGRDWDLGNAKHPPLMGWVAHIWTAIFSRDRLVVSASCNG